MSLANTQIYESTNYYVSKPNTVFMYDSWTTPSFVSTGSESFYVILLTSVNSASNLLMYSREICSQVMKKAQRVRIAYI